MFNTMCEKRNQSILPEAAVAADRPTAAIVSSVFSEWGKYFTIMEPPRLGREDYLAEVGRRANLFSLSRFTTLWQVGLDANVERALNTHFSPSQVRHVQLSDPLFVPSTEKPSLQFRPDNAISALFQALHAGQTLEIDETAEDISITNDFQSDRLVVIEDADKVGGIVAVNLASFLGAHVRIVPAKSGNDVQATQDLFRQYEEERDHSEKVRIGKLLYARLDVGLSETELAPYTYCIFFSTGTLYGAAMREVPTGHFLIYPDCGLQVLRNIAVDPILSAALLVDPTQVKISETQSVKANLTKRGAFVQTLIGRAANSVEVDFKLTQLPYDLIIFVAHGGFAKGDRVSVAFHDPDGNEHTMVVKKTHRFSPVQGADKVLIATFIEPESINGTSWLDPDKTVPTGTESIVMNLEESIESGAAKITYLERDIDMRFCNCIRLGKENYFAACDRFGSNWGPVVVNNTCNSIHYLAEFFVFGGARIYIGTMYSVLDSLASEFVEGLVRTEKTLGGYVKTFNDTHFVDDSLSCYIIYGLPTHRITVADGDNRAYFYSEIRASLTRLTKFRSDNPFSEMGEMIDWTINRLKAELHQ